MGIAGGFKVCFVPMGVLSSTCDALDCCSSDGRCFCLENLPCGGLDGRPQFLIEMHACSPLQVAFAKVADVKQ